MSQLFALGVAGKNLGILLCHEICWLTWLWYIFWRVKETYLVWLKIYLISLKVMTFSVSKIWYENIKYCYQKFPKIILSEWVKSLSRVWLFATPLTEAYQASPSMGFSRQQYQSGLSFPAPGDLPDPGVEPRFPTLRADALSSEAPLNLVNIRLELNWSFNLEQIILICCF